MEEPQTPPPETPAPEQDDANTTPASSSSKGPQLSGPLAIGRAEKGALGAVATLPVIEERVALLLSQQLEGVLQTGLSVHAEEARLIKWMETGEILEDPGCHALLEVEAMGGHAVVSVDHALFFAMLEQLFGGKKTPASSSPRARLSSIEERVLKRLLRVFAQAMEQAWKPVLPIHMNTLRVDTRPSNVAITSLDEAVVFSSYKVTLDDLQGYIYVTIPKVNIWRFKEQLASGRYEVSLDPEESSRLHLEQSLKQVHVEITAELGRTFMRLNDLAALEPGQVLRLDRSPDMPTIVQINGQSKFLGRTTVSHGNLAVDLTDAIFATDSNKPPH